MSEETKVKNRPFVVCHMLLTSLDGKIDGAFFGAPETAPALKAYGDLRKFYQCQAVLYGTITMLGGFAEGKVAGLPETDNLPEREDYVNPDGRAVENFIVSMDPEGILKFSSHILEKKGRPAAHVIEALTKKVPPEYLSYLRGLGISYVFAGQKRLDCRILLEKLSAQFGITRLMAAGGGVTNWSLLQEGLIDELSLVIAPVADGSTSAVSCFERADFMPQHGPEAFHLKDIERLEGDALWIRYER
mgnify:FL=1